MTADETYHVTSELIGSSEPATVNQLREIVAEWEAPAGWVYSVELSIGVYLDEIRVYAETENSDPEPYPTGYINWVQVSPQRYYHILAERA